MFSVKIDCKNLGSDSKKDLRDSKEQCTAFKWCKTTGKQTVRILKEANSFQKYTKNVPIILYKGTIDIV